MPIEFHDEQAVVSCKGDIATLPFSPLQEACDGIAWLLLQEREEGDVGRSVPDGDPLCLHEQPGVLIAANDPKSLDVIISALISLRNDLAIHRRTKSWEPLKDESASVERRIGDAPTFVPGLQFTSVETYTAGPLYPKGARVAVTYWPKDFRPIGIRGKVVILDGTPHEVLAIDFNGGPESQRPIGLIVAPFEGPLEEGADGGIKL
jgi:hypothetical protein